MPYRPPRHEQATVAERHTPERMNDDVYNSPRWARLRAMMLRMTPVCQACGRQPAEHVHHRIEIKNAPELTYQAANLECLCRACHTRIHAHRRAGT